VCLFKFPIDDVHSMPVGQTRNGREYLKRIAPPLREIESTPVRQHMFENSFKIDKVCVKFISHSNYR
jgi:integrator complex subunit 6